MSYRTPSQWTSRLGWLASLAIVRLRILSGVTGLSLQPQVIFAKESMIAGSCFVSLSGFAKARHVHRSCTEALAAPLRLQKQLSPER